MGNHSKCFKCGELDEFCACIPASTAPTEPVRLSEEHPNLKVPTDPACSAKLDELGDDRGQGLDPYWKFGFRTGWHHGVRSLMASTAASEQQASVSEQARARIAARFANRPRTPATADFDLPAPNDEIEVSGAHHLTPESIAATIKDLREIEDGTTERPVIDRDWRTWAGVLARVIEHLSGRATIPSEADERAMHDQWVHDQLFVCDPQPIDSWSAWKYRAALTHRATTADEQATHLTDEGHRRLLVITNLSQSSVGNLPVEVKCGACGADRLDWNEEYRIAAQDIPTTAEQSTDEPNPNEHEGTVNMKEVLTLLRMRTPQADGRNIHIVLKKPRYPQDGSIEDVNNHDRFLYNENTCPSNFLGVVELVDGDETDPVGLFQHVQTIEVLGEEIDLDNLVASQIVELFSKFEPFALDTATTAADQQGDTASVRKELLTEIARALDLVADTKMTTSTCVHVTNTLHHCNDAITGRGYYGTALAQQGAAQAQAGDSVLAPIINAVEMHDATCLNSTIPDETLIWTATSVMGEQLHVTLGDFRRIAAMSAPATSKEKA